MKLFSNLKRFFARQSSAKTEAAQDTRVQDATQARDEAAAALQAEAQAVVDRIRERPEAVDYAKEDGTVVRLIPSDPISTTTVEENGVPTIKPKRPRKPKRK